MMLCDRKDDEKFFRGMAPSIYGNTFYTENKIMLDERAKFSDILAREIPNSEYMIISDAGHVAIFEKHWELKSMIYGFILKNNK
jgi:3-oxoadipate enol-lactonase